MKDIDDYQLTLKDVVTKRCRLWDHCAYHNCNKEGGCDAYHDPRTNPRI